MKHLYILTGASRGMGLALAEQLLKPENTLLCISRQANTALEAQAAGANCQLEQWQLDLADAASAASRLAYWLRTTGGSGGSDWASATLINNAAVLPRIAPLAAMELSDHAPMAQALRVGLEAPLLLTTSFLHSSQTWTCPRKVLNISSGNGRRPMASQATYSAVKAGMDHFTRCLAVEEAAKNNGAKVCSLAPGVIDTDMQVHLRGASAKDFADHNTFVGLKLQGQLTSPFDAAARLLTYLARADYGSNPVADVRD
jgi:benzil reductase ((S)-benzoin forming)